MAGNRTERQSAEEDIGREGEAREDAGQRTCMLAAHVGLCCACSAVCASCVRKRELTGEEGRASSEGNESRGADELITAVKHGA